MPDDRRQKIARRAFEIWEREGRPDGCETEHWHHAEAEIEREEAEAAAKALGAQAVDDAAKKGRTAKAPGKSTPHAKGARAGAAKASGRADGPKKAAKTEKAATKKKK